jgi:hypothetical protein
MVDIDYDIEEWARTTTLGRRIFNYNYRMRGNELRGWELVKQTTMQDGPQVGERVYVWQRKGSEGEEVIRISIAELHHWRLALEQLRAQLSHSMRRDIARGEGRAAAGDIGFAADAPKSGIVAAVTFTRGNVCVSIASVGSQEVDVRPVARSLDAAFVELPQKKALRDRSQTVKRRAVAVKARRSTPLFERLSDAVPGGGWLKVVAPDGELSREGDALVYVSPDAGRKQVGIFTARGME